MSPLARTAAIVWAVALAGGAPAAPALFWLSLDGQSPADPAAPTVVAHQGVGRQLHIWAQPRTTGAGEHDPNFNPYLTLQNVSLNLVSPQSDFTLSDFEVHNPDLSTGNPRFDTIGDASTGLTETTTEIPPGFAKGVVDLQGFSFFAADGDGFGVACDESDTACAPTTSGGDAWLFASMTITPTTDTGTVELYLQVGRNGMNHVGESAGAMLVNFGVESINPAPIDYDPSFDMFYTDPNDDPDAVLTLARPGDYDADGDVDDDDYEIWNLDYGQAASDADGNGDGLADTADFTVWRDNLTVLPVYAVAEPVGSALAAITVASLANLLRLRRSRSSTGG